MVKRLNKFGYDGIELVVEPSWYNFNEVNKLNEEYNIKVNSICSIFTSERDLINPEKSMRIKAIDYCNLSNGMYDFTVSPLVELWGFSDYSSKT